MSQTLKYATYIEKTDRRNSLFFFKSVNFFIDLTEPGIIYCCINEIDVLSVTLAIHCKFRNNKKVLLHARKRFISRGLASTCSLVWRGEGKECTPVLVLAGDGGGATPCPGPDWGRLRYPELLPPTPLARTWDRTFDRTSDKPEGYPQKGPVTRDWVPLPLERTWDQRLGYPFSPLHPVRLRTVMRLIN